MRSNYLVVAISTLFVSTFAFADAEIEKGKAVYEGAGACSSCHGMGGLGDGAAASALPVKPANFVVGNYKYDTDKDGKMGTETDIFNIITDGAQKHGGNMMMVSRADLPEADRKALAKYVHSLKKGHVAQ